MRTGCDANRIRYEPEKVIVMKENGLEEEGTRFLLGLFDAVNGDTSAKTSLYDVGETLGLDRDRANYVATELIGNGYAEIKTLSGAIGITDEGVSVARELGAGGSSGRASGVRLGEGPVMDNDSKEACDAITAGLKSESAKLGLDFDAMSEMAADLKTIDAQLNSPRPKTAIVRECFLSIRAVLQKAGAGEAAGRIDGFI